MQTDFLMITLHACSGFRSFRLLSPSSSALFVMASLCALVSLCPQCAQAQPEQAPLSQERRRADEQKRVAFTKQKIEPLLAVDAAGALRRAQEFLKADPDLVPEERLNFYREVSLKLYDASNWNPQSAPVQREHDQGLLEFLEVGLQESSLPPGTASDRLPLQKLTVILMLRQNQLSQAQQRLEERWNDAMSSDGDFLSWVGLRRDLYLRQGQESKIVPMIRGAIESRLQLRHQFDASLCQLMAQNTREQGQSAQSLSWGKLNFMLCTFNEAETAAAARTLAQTWTYDLAVSQVKAFVAAQTDPAAPNPLDKIALPVFDAPFRELLQTATGRAKADKDARAIISLSIAAGDLRGAMIWARNGLAQEMGSEESVRQVARVFKAKDLNLVRANQFTSFYGSGEGVNPMVGFFEAGNGVAATEMTAS